MGISIDEYKNKIINLAIVALAVFTSFHIYKKQDKAIEALREKRAVEMNKNNVLGDIALLEKRLLAYRKYLNQKDETSIMKTISAMAEKYGIKVSSLKPQPEINVGVYTKLPLRLVLSAKGYHHLSKFISELESSSYIYYVDALTLALSEEPGLKAELILSTFFYKG
jgi:Tfp pilus assembly protein PilO